MEIKSPTTFEEQVKILKERGVCIRNDAEAEKVLEHINYYTLSGYLHSFKSDDNKIENITFEKLIAIYQCDKRFKNIILFALDEIEQNLKTKIAYITAHQIGALGYADVKNFKCETRHTEFMKKLQEVVKSNKKLPFVEHHFNIYDGKFPIWVIINLFTLGMLKRFYDNLNVKCQKLIAKKFKLSVGILKNWITCVSYLRNLAAHYMRLYNFKISLTPSKDKKSKINFSPTYGVFDIIYIMKELYPDEKEWNNFVVTTIKQIFDEYSSYIDIKAYGFADNWERLLRI